MRRILFFFLCFALIFVGCKQKERINIDDLKSNAAREAVEYYWLLTDSAISVFHDEAMKLNGNNCDVLDFTYDNISDICCKYKDGKRYSWVEYVDTALCDKSSIYNEFLILHIDDSTMMQLLDGDLIRESYNLERSSLFKLDHAFKIFWDKDIDCYRLVYTGGSSVFDILDIDTLLIE